MANNYSNGFFDFKKEEEKEIWTPIKAEEFIGLYEISTLARVKSLPREKKPGSGYEVRKEKIMKPTLCTTGEPVIMLQKDKKYKSFRLGFLVLTHFVGNPPEHSCYRFLDGNKSNCRLDNLEWEDIHQEEEIKEDSPEIWRCVPDTCGFYEGSTLGRIKSNARIVLRKDGRRLPVKEKILNPTTKHAYPAVSLYVNGTIINKLVHQIILETFVGPCPEGKVCRHKNSNPYDNRLVNLCWGTQQDNIRDQILLGTDTFRKVRRDFGVRK